MKLFAVGSREAVLHPAGAGIVPRGARGGHSIRRSARLPRNTGWGGMTFTCSVAGRLARPARDGLLQRALQIGVQVVTGPGKSCRPVEQFGGDLCDGMQCRFTLPALKKPHIAGFNVMRLQSAACRQ